MKKVTRYVLDCDSDVEFKSYSEAQRAIIAKYERVLLNLSHKLNNKKFNEVAEILDSNHTALQHLVDIRKEKMLVEAGAIEDETED